MFFRVVPSTKNSVFTARLRHIPSFFFLRHLLSAWCIPLHPILAPQDFAEPLQLHVGCFGRRAVRCAEWLPQHDCYKYTSTGGGLNHQKKANVKWCQWDFMCGIGVHHNGWFKMENPIKMDDWRVPAFMETPRWFIIAWIVWIYVGIFSSCDFHVILRDLCLIYMAKLV